MRATSVRRGARRTVDIDEPHDRAAGEDLTDTREGDLAAVEAFLVSAAAAATAMVVEGEPGIGKTTVWRAAVERARGRGFRLFCSRPAAAEAKLSFAGLGDLLAEVGDDVLASLPPPQERALQAALLRRPPHRPAAGADRGSAARGGLPRPVKQLASQR